MHVVFIANADYLADELPEFRQLCVGLVDEQVQITRIVPADAVRLARRGGDALDRREADVGGGLRDREREGRSARRWDAMMDPADAGPSEGPLSNTPMLGRRPDMGSVALWGFESPPFGAFGPRFGRSACPLGGCLGGRSSECDSCAAP